MTTINGHYNECTNYFKNLASAVESQSCIASNFPPKNIADLQKRFDDWAEVVGAAHPPGEPNSLDFRLGPSGSYTVSVTYILDRLGWSLTTATQVLSGDESLANKAERTTEPKFERHPDSDSDEASTTSSPKSSNFDEADMIKALYNSIKNTISKLESLIPALSSQGKQTDS